MMWIGIICAYLVGFVLQLRPSLRRHMERDCCRKCRLGTGHRSCKDDRATRGAVSDRDGEDALWAIFEAAWWPVYMAGASLAQLAGLAWRGATRFILGGPLSVSEFERHERELTASLAGRIHTVDVTDYRFTHGPMTRYTIDYQE